MSSTSRRRFIGTFATTAIGSILLKGCLGNPPAANTPSTPTTTATGGGTAGEPPETPKIKLGYIPILEAAPLIIAQEKGFFAKHGMTEVEVAKQASWAAARDNVVLGSAGGGIDGGQWQLPMPHLITEGIITNGNKVPMYVLLQTSTQGNGIAVAGIHKGKGLHLDVSKAADYIKGFAKTNGRKFKAAHTFPNANQELWIRYWFAAGGVDPDQDIELLTVPAAETVQGMRNGTMDAFSTGDPWPYRIVSDNIGHMAALTEQIWKFHPEEYLAIRADWVDKHPKATKAVLKAVMEAQQWLDDPANRPEAIQILSGRNFFNVPADVLTPPLQGKYSMGDGQPPVDDFKAGPLFWKDGLGSVSYPYKSHELWSLTETMRWNFHGGKIKDFDMAKSLINRVNRADLWVEAAKELGVTDIPSSDSRGVEKLFDGKEFDPSNPEAYLKSLNIKRV